MTQLSLLETLEADKPIAERFAAFHKRNPWVFQSLVRMARDLRSRGIQHYGIKALWEVLRYDWTVRTSDPNSQLKLCNDYTAFYAREIMRLNPDLEGFFTTRRSQADQL